MSQKKQILAFMQTGKSITPMEAWELFGCYRLSARVSDLRAEGHNIVTTLKEGTNRNGEPIRYASYSLRN